MTLNRGSPKNSMIILKAEPVLSPTHTLRPVCLRTLGWLLLLFLATQLIFLGRPTVNTEHAFVEAALSLANMQPQERIDYFWYYQANPLGYPLNAAMLLQLLPMLKPLAVVRLLSVLGGMLLLISMADLLRYLPETKKTADRWSLILLAVHPMVWIYSNNATADILPAGLILGALACCCRGRTNMFWHLLGILLFSSACIVKFNSALIGGAFVFILLTWASYDRERWLIHTGWLIAYAVCSIATLLAYFVWIYHQFNIIILPERYKEIFTSSLSIEHAALTLLFYLGFLMIFAGPLVLVMFSTLLKKRDETWFNRRLLALICFYCLVVVSIDGMNTPGEMNFGRLAKLLPPLALTLVYASGISMVLLFFHLCARSLSNPRQQGFLGLILSASIPFLLISSATRPAQRYLILILPLLLAWFVHLAWQLRPVVSRILMIATFIVFIGLSTLGSLYLNSKALAAERMAHWVRDHDLIEETNPRILANHIGSYFPLQKPAKPQYRMEIWPRKQDLSTLTPEHIEPLSIGPFLIKRYVLVPIVQKEPQKEEPEISN